MNRSCSGIQARRRLRALEVEGEPLLDAAHAGPLRQVEEQRQVEHQRRGQDRVAAEEIDLDLHRVAQPPEDVDVVPAFLVVAAGRVVVDPHLVVHLAVELGIELRLQDVLQHAELRLFLGLEALGVVEHLAVAVAEDVGRVPARDAQHAGLEHRREHGLDHGLAGLEVLAADGDALRLGQRFHRREVAGQVGRAVGERHALLDGRVGVEHRRRDGRVVRVHRLLERLERPVGRARADEDLGRRAPDHDQPVAAVLAP